VGGAAGAQIASKMSAKTVIPKFDNSDRHRVVHRLKESGLALSKQGRKDRQLVDVDGNLYFLVGGVETWNRISEEDRHDAQKVIDAGHHVELIYCLKNRKTIEVFKGVLTGLVVLPGKGDIAIIRHGNTLKIRQLPDVRLFNVDEFSHTEDDRHSQKTSDSLVRDLKKMSAEERRDLLSKLAAGNGDEEP
jgi:hypothetical protein